MALNDEEKTGEQIRVIYKVNYSANDSSVLASLSVIPVTDYYRNGYHSEWEEVKQQIIDLSFKEKPQIPDCLQYVAVIKTLEYELDINSREDYFTALKVAELYGQPLDVMIKTGSEPVFSQIGNTVPQAPVSNSIATDSNQKVERQSSLDSTEANNGFVLLNHLSNKNNASEEKMVVMSEQQIEKIKKEITIDVTKRLITKLSECLTELTTNDNTAEQSQNQEYVNDYLTGAEGGQPIPKVVHRGIICDNCDQQIEGIRYKCVNCLDYDLCEACRQKAVHFPNHSFNKIERYIRGIPKQTLPPNLDFLKPFLSGATIDPSTKDVILTLDVDLTNGTISKTNISQPMHSDNVDANQNNDDNLKQNEQTNGSSNKKSVSDDEYHCMIGPQLPQKRYCSERRAKQITKKLEKLKQKSQLYNNLLQTSEDRYSLSAFDRSKQSTAGPIIPNPSIVSNKTLYLSGLLIGDETIPEGTRMPPNTKFRKTWRVRNTGTKVWSGRTTLRFVWGHPELEPFGKVTEVQAPTLRPGEEGKVTIRFTSPNASTVTRYQSYWRLHHRGQPFGPRLVVKIIVDPMATAITPTPTPMAPILSKDSRSAMVMPPASRMTARAPYPGPTYSVNDTTCNLEAMAHIQQSIFESQRQINDRLSTMSSLTKEPTRSPENKEKTQKTSAKKLTEALSQVKELRFDLDENETIPMKSNVKSHTTTPANTPFDVSPPKSPEPTTSANTFSQLDSQEKPEKMEKKCEEKIEEEKHDNDNGNESDGESLDVLSLSSGNESGDEFVLVPFPTCFDLNVPFVMEDNKDVNTDSSDSNPQNNTELNCFEIVEKQTKDGESSESDDDNTLQTEEKNNELVEPKEMKDLLSQPNEEIALDLTKEKLQTINVCADTHPKETDNQTPTQSNSSSDNEPQLRSRIPNSSTNPFRNNTNETENVIHVLPESIVTGALSAAAHVYNNVSRALFSRNEGNNFAWVTSPPPAALPLPNMYWDNRSSQYHPSQPQYYGPPSMTPMPVPTAPQMQSSASAQDQTQAQRPHIETTTRLTSSLKQLYEMGFWNQKLNQELLEKNDFDVNDTIEDLLSPDKNRHSRHGVQTAAEPVVSHQPTNNRNGFIDEFD